MSKSCKNCRYADEWEAKGWTICAMRNGIPLDDDDVEEAAELCEFYCEVAE